MICLDMDIKIDTKTNAISRKGKRVNEAPAAILPVLATPLV